MIMIFKKGTKHNFHGVECDLMRIEPSAFPSHKNDGWVLDHRELIESEKPESEDTEKPEQVKPYKNNRKK